MAARGRQPLVGGAAVGFRYRKSKSFGPFRVTASKRGVSMSVGSGPFRVTASSNGRVTKTVRIPGTGMSYVSTSSAKGRSGANSDRRGGAGSALISQSPARLAIRDESWRILLAPDGTPSASKFQRNYVRAMAKRVGGVRPSLAHLTIGQAERILKFLGKSPSRLNRWGRGVPEIERFATISQWTLLGLVLLIMIFSSPGGILVAAAIAGLVLLLMQRRRRRQVWEDAHWARSDDDAPIATVLAPPIAERTVLEGPKLALDVPAMRAPTRVEPACIAPRQVSASPYFLSLGRSAWPNVELKGEFAYSRTIRAALRASKAWVSNGHSAEVEGLPVELVPEPDNPYDTNAISVRWRNGTVGYLSQEDALRYAQPIRRIIASGLSASTTARIWAYETQGKLEASITATLPEPELIVPLNDAPAAVHTVIPWGSAVQVLKEEEHLDVLFNYVPKEGVGLLLVGLNKATQTLKNGTERSYVEVRLDGQRVGELSGVTSPHFLPLIAHTEAVGELAVAYAKITGSALAARLKLQAAKATEISNEWLATRPHPAPELVPWAPSYEVPARYSE